VPLNCIENDSPTGEIMHIQINTDRHIQGHQEFLLKISTTLESALSRISNHITRLEVHLSDENGDKKGKDDKRCVLEARLEGHNPVVVIEQAETLDKAIDSAADKLFKRLDSMLERLHK
jgi:ribosome-associated translation inhibitor RaiA